MAQEAVPVTLVEKEQKGKVQKIKEFLGIGKTASALKESDRFERLGYFQYPKDQQLDFRIKNLFVTLRKIANNYTRLYQQRENLIASLGKTTSPIEVDQIQRQLDAIQHIQYPALQRKATDELSDAFEVYSAPWCRGLSNPRLAKKIKAYYKVLCHFGQIPSIYRILNYLTHLLLNQSWMPEDVQAQTPLLFETRTTIQPGYNFRPEMPVEKFGQKKE